LKNTKSYLYEGFVEYKRNFLIYSLLWFILFYLPSTQFDEDSATGIMYFLMFLKNIVYYMLLTLIIKNNIMNSKKSVKEYIVLIFKRIIPYATTFLSMLSIMIPVIFLISLPFTVVEFFLKGTEYILLVEIFTYTYILFVMYFSIRKIFLAPTIYLLIGIKNFAAIELNKKIADNNLKIYNFLFIIFLFLPVLLGIIESVITDSFLLEIIFPLQELVFISLEISFVIYILNNVKEPGFNQ